MQRGAAPQVESTSTQTTARTPAPVSANVPGIEPAGLSGIEYPRFFTREGSIRSTRSNGTSARPSSATRRASVVFEQRDVEIPRFWSQQATNIVVSKYFRGVIGTPERERSVKQLIGRVVDTITGVGARSRSTSRARTICRRSATT